MMLKEFGAIVKVLDKLKTVLEDSKLKEKWDKEKLIKGRLILEGYQIDFILKEAEKDGVGK